MTTNYDDIYYLVYDVLDSMRTEDIVPIYNKYCEDNFYSGIVYNMYELDEQLCNYSPSKILNNISDDFNIRDNYFYITDCEEIRSFNWTNDSDCPFYLDELAKWIVENDEDCGCYELQNALDCE